MIIKTKNGAFVLSGIVPKDAEFSTVGQNNSSLCKWGVKVAEVDKNTVWANCKAWHEVARTAANIKKGDHVLCTGNTETREYNGKIYEDYTCEFVAVIPKNSAPLISPIIDPEPLDLSEFDDLGDGDAPF